MKLSMKQLLLTALLLQSLSICGQGFMNPVLPGFHADPSVCRAGDRSGELGTNRQLPDQTNAGRLKRHRWQQRHLCTYYPIQQRAILYGDNDLSIATAFLCVDRRPV